MFSNVLYRDLLTPPSIEFTIENLLPWTKVKITIGHCNNYLTPHNLTFEMSVSIIFTCLIFFYPVELYTADCRYTRLDAAARIRKSILILYAILSALRT